jgi:hypothetical protein
MIEYNNIINIIKINIYNKKMKNTVLFVEPRVFKKCPDILNQFVNILGTNWEYIFYCGKGTLSYWENTNIHKIYEIRELDVNNFPTEDLYSDFMKQKSLWESLSGEYVLTAQMDTWITNDFGYTIDDFIKLNKSFIGGNMSYPWFELSQREGIDFNYKNFNGGLSLRNRLDMLKVINHFPPEKTSINNDVLTRNIHTDAEDIYFVLGCYKLGLPIGNDEKSSHFAIHTIFKEQFFGIHKPGKEIENILQEHYHNIYLLNPYL